VSRALLALTVGVASLACASLAHAGSSGGGSSGGGSSGGGSSGGSSVGWSSGDSSSGGSGESLQSACTDDTDVVGYRRCTRFGAWARWRAPLAFLEVGTAVRTFASPLGESTGTVSHDAETFTYRAIGTPSRAPDPSSSSSDSAVLLTIRGGIGLSHGFYVAAETELGGLVRNSSHVEMTSTGTFGAPTIEATGGSVIGGLVIAGVRGEVGSGSLGVEVAAGGRSIMYTYESHYLACRTGDSKYASSPVLEARVRATHWVSPFVNVGATAGASVIDRSSWVLGLHVGLVSRAYGNQRE
jgi:hypothetical protein